MTNNDSGQTVSLWMTTEHIPAPPPLTENTQVDVCVIGAGISGMTTAYLLAREGNNVMVIDDGPIGGGETGRTTAHISTGLDDGYREYERLHGAEGARLAAESAMTAIEIIERNVREEKIDCDFERLDAYLFLAPGQSKDILDQELAAAHHAGMKGVERLARAPLDFLDTGVCLRFPEQGQFHPLKYLAGLAKAIAARGGRIHTRTPARHIKPGRDGEPGYVETENGYTIHADAVVVATNSPMSDLVSVHAKQAPYRSYAIAARVNRESVPRALYWDTADPYHYVRVQTVQHDGRNQDMLIVGGEDHRTGHEEDYEARWDRLEAWARERFPMMQAVEYRWSGQVMEPVDGLPFIGRDPELGEHAYIITGDSGDGMINGTIGGILVTDLIMKRQNAWQTLYDPGRRNLRALNRLLSHNIDALQHYREFVTPGDVSSEEEISPGSGAIMRSGVSKVAVYRDDQGNTHKISAVCTHLKCIVHWNDAEKTWDCPCHGSRFDRFGKVLNGPASADLPPA